MTSYEWDIELLDAETGDILDHDHRDKLADFQIGDEDGSALVLVRDTGNEDDGLQDRLWAYVTDGKLPEFFSDSGGRATGYKVPQRFHREVAKRYKTVTA